MERVIEANYFVLSAVSLSYLPNLSGEFDGGFVGFATRITDEDFGGRGHGARGAGFLYEELGEGTDPGVVVEIGGMDESASLLANQL